MPRLWLVGLTLLAAAGARLGLTLVPVQAPPPEADPPQVLALVAPPVDLKPTPGQPEARQADDLQVVLTQRPVEFLEMCQERYRREVAGYSLIMAKRERVAGKMHPAKEGQYEVVQAHFRENPFSVHLTWLENPKRAARVLYVANENEDKLLCRPAGLLGLVVVARDVAGAEARESGRYTVNQFGLYLAVQRMITNMRQAEARGELHVRYVGQEVLPEAGNRPCYKFVRGPYVPPEEDGIAELTIYIDCETWLNVGSVLRDSQGQLIAEYYFRDIQLNPQHSESQFAPSAL